MIVVISKQVDKALRRLPDHIVGKLFTWKRIVERQGIEAARRIPGYHDEPLQGARGKKQQRSIRLSLGYRAIYTIGIDGVIEFIYVVEVNNHDY